MATKSLKNKIPFGLKNGIMHDVTGVESGRACDCICPSCQQPLQARKGSKKRHHFAHDTDVQNISCDSAFETSIHLMTKQIISEDKTLSFPSLEISETLKDENGAPHTQYDTIEKETKKYFRKVVLEKRLDQIRPDIIAFTQDDTFLIEVAVTSFCDKAKIKKIRNTQIAAIEIDLSCIDYGVTKEELRDHLHDQNTKKKWLYHPREKSAQFALSERLKNIVKEVNEKLQIIKRPLSSMNQTVNHELCKKYKKSRWFTCEACKRVFEKNYYDTQLESETIKCTHCSSNISTASSRFNN